MVLAGVDLTNNPADPWAIVAKQDEQVLNNEPISRQLVDQFHMSQTPLLVRAYFIAALDDVNPLVLENPMGLPRGLEVQV